MSKKNKKQILFDKFSNQLSLLKQNGLIDVDLKYDKTYICPICLNQFSNDDLKVDYSKNFLTEEDAPPDSLGGSRIALTCKKCNTECGHKIDYHLKELITDEENSKFVKGTVQAASVDFNGKAITVQLTSDGGGELKAMHDEKRNDPSIFHKFINSLKAGTIIQFRRKKSRVDAKKVNYAFLKTNYIITFSKFGYIFILDKAYDIIREQILNPENEIIKYNLTIHNDHLSAHIGTHYVIDKEIKSIFNVFNLKSKHLSKPYGAFLPVPGVSLGNFVTEMIKKAKNGKAVFNKSDYDENANLFTDLNEIRKIKNWINN